jgi:hypothetical protein
MNIRILAIVAWCAAFASMPAIAAAPADAPAGSNGICKDGTYSNAAMKKGACKGHKGVKDWWGVDSSTPAKSGASPTSAPAAAATPAPAPAAAPSAPAPSTQAPAATKASSSKAPEPAASAAPGGGPGLVWVNSESKVYHCPGDRWYGKTKQGSYMSESDAIAKGNHADHGKSCK